MLKTLLLVIILILNLITLGLFITKYPDTPDELQKKYGNFGSNNSESKIDTEAPNQPSRDSLSANPEQNSNNLSTQPNNSGEEAENKNINNSTPVTDNTLSEMSHSASPLKLIN